MQYETRSAKTDLAFTTPTYKDSIKTIWKFIRQSLKNSLKSSVNLWIHWRNRILLLLLLLLRYVTLTHWLKERKKIEFIVL